MPSRRAPGRLKRPTAGSEPCRYHETALRIGTEDAARRDSAAVSAGGTDHADVRRLAVVALGVALLILQVLVIFITEDWFDFIAEFTGVLFFLSLCVVLLLSVFAEGARFFYLSVISLTSVGFGDMAPLHPFARSLVMLEAIVGQIYTTVILAWMVSLAVRSDRRH
jgi:Ion channel